MAVAAQLASLGGCAMMSPHGRAQQAQDLERLRAWRDAMPPRDEGGEVAP